MLIEKAKEHDFKVYIGEPETTNIEQQQLRFLGSKEGVDATLGYICKQLGNFDKARLFVAPALTSLREKYAKEQAEQAQQTESAVEASNTKQDLDKTINLMAQIVREQLLKEMKEDGGNVVLLRQRLFALYDELIKQAWREEIQLWAYYQAYELKYQHNDDLGVKQIAVQKMVDIKEQFKTCPKTSATWELPYANDVLNGVTLAQCRTYTSIDKKKHLVELSIVKACIEMKMKRPARSPSGQGETKNNEEEYTWKVGHAYLKSEYDYRIEAFGEAHRNSVQMMKELGRHIAMAPLNDCRYKLHVDAKAMLTTALTHVTSRRYKKSIKHVLDTLSFDFKAKKWSLQEEIQQSSRMTIGRVLEVYTTSCQCKYCTAVPKTVKNFEARKQTRFIFSQQSIVKHYVPGFQPRWCDDRKKALNLLTLFVQQKVLGSLRGRELVSVPVEEQYNACEKLAVFGMTMDKYCLWVKGWKQSAFHLDANYKKKEAKIAVDMVRVHEMTDGIVQEFFEIM